jgi:hypothetical protein
MIADGSTGLVRLNEAQRLLAAIETPRDAKSAIAAFDVLKRVAKELGLSLHEQNQIAEGRLRAQRRGGELLKPDAEHRGGSKTRVGFLNEAGLDDHESIRWQSIAGLPLDVFEGYIADVLASDDELTTAGLLRLVPKPPKAVPDPDSVPLEGPLLRFSQADLPTATIIALILRVAFPDAETALDMTYGSGNFWDGSAHVRVTAHDVRAARAPDGVVDFAQTGYEDGSYDVTIFDPPHLADTGVASIMGQHFGSYASYAELEAAICSGAREAWRVARLGTIVKVTDHVHAHQYVIESDWVRAAFEGRAPYDVVHQVRSGALVAPIWEEQLSAYNNGATYLIFRKGDQKHVRRLPVA